MNRLVICFVTALLLVSQVPPTTATSVLKTSSKSLTATSPGGAVPSRTTPVQDFLYWPTGVPVVVPRRYDPPAQPWLVGHRGIDLGVTPGDRVYAAADSTVIYAGNLAGRSLISLEDALGRRYTYEPVTPLVTVGDFVSRGQVIGVAQDGHYPGDTRLHFGVKEGATGYVDPLRLLGGAIRLWPVA